MTLGAYFDQKDGTGVLATSDSEGRVDAAIYARPYVVDEGTVAFIMADRLSHDNLQSNPHAGYLFIEEGKGYVGKRLFLTKTREETDSEQIETIRRRNLPPECNEGDTKKKFLVHFRVDGIRPLIGTGE